MRLLVEQIICLSVVFFTVSTVVVAADAPTGATDPKQAEMMAKWTAYATPGEAHKRLAPLAGKWSYTSKWWEAPNAKPEESKGTSTMRMILGGRFLEHTTKGKAMGMPFEGLGITAYDNIKGKYETLWMDTMGTGIMHGTGAWDTATSTLSDAGEHTCPISPSGKRTFRSDWKIVDKNNMVLTMYGPDMSGSGSEFKNGELVFKRLR